MKFSSVLLRRARKAKGWTQAEFAEKINVHPRTVQQWEANQIGMTDERASVVRKILGDIGDMPFAEFDFDEDRSNEMMDAEPEVTRRSENREGGDGVNGALSMDSIPFEKRPPMANETTLAKSVQGHKTDYHLIKEAAYELELAEKIFSEAMETARMAQIKIRQANAKLKGLLKRKEDNYYGFK